jgi:hypothetical protein
MPSFELGAALVAGNVRLYYIMLCAYQNYDDDDNNNNKTAIKKWQLPE